MVKKTSSKSILVTGSSTGIGYCVAHGLKDRGYRVFASARKTQDVQKLEREGFESCLIDYRDSTSISKGLSYVLERTEGTLDALFNNGAYGQPGALEDLPREALKAQFESNVFGWHELTKEVIPIMRQQGQGRIIQNSSILGLVSMKYRGAYNASKYAIEGLTDTLRLELHDTNIHVSLIEPGPIESKFRENALEKFNQYIKREKSFHKASYEKVFQRLENKEPSSSFTLPPEAVLKKVIHALESKHPKAHYYVTFPTYLFAYLKRALPTPWLDYWLKKVH